MEVFIIRDVTNCLYDHNHIDFDAGVVPKSDALT